MLTIWCFVLYNNFWWKNWAFSPCVFTKHSRKFDSCTLSWRTGILECAHNACSTTFQILFLWFVIVNEFLMSHLHVLAFGNVPLTCGWFCERRHIHHKPFWKHQVKLATFFCQVTAQQGQTTTPGTPCPTLFEQCVGSFTSHRIIYFSRIYSTIAGHTQVKSYLVVMEIITWYPFQFSFFYTKKFISWILNSNPTKCQRLPILGFHVTSRRCTEQ